MVKSVYSCGKPGFGVGQGNTQEIICDDWTDLETTCAAAVANRAWDLGVPCTGDQMIHISAKREADFLAAVEKGVISVTCDVDTTQLGQYSVEALTNYIKDGRTNSYYNVDINFLDRAAVEKMRREADTDEKASVE